jgi:endonuclease/exonuclease/phosphatase family metal-dependent hydrolase
VLQEAVDPAALERIAEAAGFPHAASRPGQSLAFMARRPPVHHAWHKPRLSRHAFLEIVPEGDTCRIFGLHLSAVHSAWTERRRVLETRALLSAVARHQHGLHLLLGDFNTLAPNEPLDVGALPRRLRPFVWMSGGRIRWRTIEIVLSTGYVDAFRRLHPEDAGLTFPVWNPHVRLDYVFVPDGFADRLLACDVLRDADTRAASDHHPILAEVVT